MFSLDEYESKGTKFPSQFPGFCTINREHRIKPNSIVVRVRLVSNPYYPVPGVACATCTKLLNPSKL